MDGAHWDGYGAELPRSRGLRGYLVKTNSAGMGVIRLADSPSRDFVHSVQHHMGVATTGRTCSFCSSRGAWLMRIC